MKYKNLELLIYLAKKTRLFSTYQTSTTKIAVDLKTSQQTISRKIRELEKKGYINRIVNYKGQKLNLTKDAITLLKNHKNQLKELLKQKKVSIKGKIVQGVGEGKYYISIKKYKNGIKNSFGFTPFPGTLNLKVNKQEIPPFLSTIPNVRIKGFKTGERSFGYIDCYPIQFKKTKAIVVIPERTRYNNILEIVAPFNLRKKYNLINGVEIKIR